MLFLGGNMHSAIRKILDFTGHPLMRDYFANGVNGFFSAALAEHGFEDLDELEANIGQVAFKQLFPCMVEFFLSNRYRQSRKKGRASIWSAVDVFLDNNRGKVTDEERDYLLALRDSSMSVYEVVAVEPETALVLKDLLAKGPPVRVLEKSLTRKLRVGDCVGIRVVKLAEHNEVAGGVLPLSHVNVKELCREITFLHQSVRLMSAQDTSQADVFTAEEEEHLMRVMYAPSIAEAYIAACLERIDNLDLRNTSGHALVPCTLTLPVRQDPDNIRVTIGNSRVFHDSGESTKTIWRRDWVEPKEKGRFKPLAGEEGNPHIMRLDTEVIGPDGQCYLQLGTFSLYKRKIVLKTNSRERGNVFESLICELLGYEMGEAKWDVEDYR